MSRHIRSCLKKELQKRPVAQTENLMHLHISAPYVPDYFLHILILGKTKLRDLDNYLRAIWLECCGHMSAFSARMYRDELSMNASFEDVFAQTSELKYQYDFGDTTELVIRMLDIYPGTPDVENSINLLSRNSQPMIPCEKCGKHPATEICSECQWDGEGWLCAKCAQDHDCDEEMMLPVSNSPRTGVCGYSADDEDEVITDEQLLSATIFQPSGKKSSKKSSKESNPKIERVVAIKNQIRFFCKRYLNKELEGYALKLADIVSRRRKIDITRGKMEIWAAAIIYAIARLNFLFDPEHANYITADTICDFFKTKKSTVGNKATQIEDACDLDIGSEGYCSQEICDTFTLLESPQGFVFPKSMMREMGPLFAKNIPQGMEAELLLKLFEEVGSSIPKGMRQDVKTAFELLLDEVVRETGERTDEPPNIMMLDETIKERQRRERQEKKAMEQQKIAESEQNMIDNGQLSFFD